MVGGGTGAFIGGVHRMAARIDDQWELVAGAFQSDAAKSVAFGRSLGLDGARCYGDYIAMASSEQGRADRIDAVSIVTPNSTHAPIALTFLAAGIPVICDKPLTVTRRDALVLSEAVAQAGVPFVLTHNYSGYPMVRQARAMVEAGELGEIRVVQAEYAQDWLARDQSGNKQADWRGDPSRAGPGGALGDIATHAFQLVEFVTGMVAKSVAADLATFVAGRKVDDNVNVMLRFPGAARGMLWASQVATGSVNGLRLRVFGDKGGIEWAQETPETLQFTPLGQPPRIYRRGGPGLSASAQAARAPAGHPEGYLEGFAQIYSDAAELIRAHQDKREPKGFAKLAPGIADGVRGVQFIEAAVKSSGNNGAWTAV
jgi:predicted dehydrogenase